MAYTKQQQAEWKKRHYAENKYRYYVDRDRHHATRRAALDKIKSVPCLDCGVQYHPEVMEFDHVRGEKSFNVSSHITRKWETVLAEVAKCDIVCANCHRMRTISRRSSLG